MSKLSEKDEANLMNIIDAASKIQRFTQKLENADEFYENELIFDAVLMNFVIIGESVARISEELILDNQHIEWRAIKQLRNIVAHNYFGVDAEEIWQIIQNNIAKLIEDVNGLL